MNHYAAQWIEDWCSENGWTDLFRERTDYWAFPPNAVMPVPIPTQVLRSIKANRGLCFEEKGVVCGCGTERHHGWSVYLFLRHPNASGSSLCLLRCCDGADGR